MTKVKTKLEIAEAVNKIKLPERPAHEIMADNLAKDAVETYAYDLLSTDYHYDQRGLKDIIKDAILEGIELYKIHLP